MAIVAVSGGIDSLASLLLLKDTGCRITALHCLFHEDAPPRLREGCQKLGVELAILDLRREFRERVIEPYLASLQAGLTPNPCALCNREMKFGLLRERCPGTLATGHYVALARGEQGEAIPARGADQKKDQSYFLSLVPSGQLSDVIFPLGKWEKEKVKEFMAGRGLLPPVAKESQDICFLSDRHAFLERHLGKKKGRFVLVDGKNRKVAGEHTGYWHYTAGQRRGLGIPWREPLYVLGREGEDVLVGPRKRAALVGVGLRDWNLYVPMPLWPRDLYGKVGYNRKLAPCTAKLVGNILEMEFATPQLVVSPGQVGCIYDGAGRVLCGGIVAEAKLAESI